MHFNEGFIGALPNNNLKFSGGDQEFRYLENLSNQPIDWYYRNVDISYNYNLFGHRCKNIEDIDLDNYLLFTGCSHTEGVGLELEKTFPYLISNELGIDYYNLAIGGTGIDIMTYNLMIWLHTIKKLPKALIIVWPEAARFSLKNERDFFLVNPSVTDENLLNFLVLGDLIGYFESSKYLCENLINTCYSNYSKLININSRSIEWLDLARDQSHAGILSNEKLARVIIDQLQ